MPIILQILVVILIGVLINKLSDRYDFPVPDWLLWSALLGLVLISINQDKLPKLSQRLAGYLRQADLDQISQWIVWGGLGLFLVAIVAAMVWSRRQNSKTGAQTALAPSLQTRAAADLRQRLVKVMHQYVAIRRRESLHNHQLIDVQMSDFPEAVGRQGQRPLVPKFEARTKSLTPQPVDMQLGLLNIRRMLSIFGRNTGRKASTVPEQELAPETSIVSVFQRDEVDQRLLILGEPGSGKTTYLLELAWDLVQ